MCSAVVPGHCVFPFPAFAPRLPQKLVVPSTLQEPALPCPATRGDGCSHLPSQDNGMHSMACADPTDPRSSPSPTPTAGILPKSSSPSCRSKIPRPDPSCKHCSRQGSDSGEFFLSCSTVPLHTQCPGCHREHLSQSSCYTGHQAQKTAQTAGLFPGPSQSFLSSILILALRPRDPDPISQATSQPGRV